MPVDTFTIAANLDDQVARVTASFGPPATNILDAIQWSWLVSRYLSASYYSKNVPMRLFKGITIPQGATINSATFRCYAAKGTGGVTPPSTFTVRADSRATPAIPAQATKVTKKSYMLPTATVTGKATFTLTAGTRSQFVQTNVDVTALIQTLVNNNGYSNGDMMLYMTYASPVPSYTDIGFYAKNWYTSPPPGGTSRVASLIIDYTAGSSLGPDKTTYRYG